MPSQKSTLEQQARKLANEIRQTPYRKKSGITEEKLLDGYHALRSAVAESRPDLEAFLPPILEIWRASGGERFAHERPDELCTFLDQLAGLLQSTGEPNEPATPLFFHLGEKAKAFVHSIGKMPEGLKNTYTSVSYCADFNRLGAMVRQALPDHVQILSIDSEITIKEPPRRGLGARTFENIRKNCEQIIEALSKSAIDAPR
jgi:hypothetical protein